QRVGLDQLLFTGRNALADVVGGVAGWFQLEGLVVVVEGGRIVVLVLIIKHAELEVSQGGAWILLHRALEAFDRAFVIQGRQSFLAGLIVRVLLLIGRGFRGSASGPPAAAEQNKNPSERCPRRHAGKLNERAI